MLRIKRDWVDGWVFVAPIVVGTLAFKLLPILVAFGTSLTEWDLITRPRFIGLRNYIYMFAKDPNFRLVMTNTVYFVFVRLPLNMSIALVLALLVNRPGIKGMTFFRTAIFAPVVTSEVAIGLIWSWILIPKYGLLNGILGSLGVPDIDFLGRTVWAMPAVIVVSVWRGVGYNMVLFLAGLQNIPDSLYESAMLDGATPWKRFWYITMPMLSPMTFFITVMTLISSFQMFGLIYVMTQGGPGLATSVLIFRIWQEAFAYLNMGYANAMSIIFLLIIYVLTIVQFRLSRRWVFYR
jgi:multiple sugar transport system permease protein